MFDIFADKTKIPLPVETPETAHFWAAQRPGSCACSGVMTVSRCISRLDPFVLPAPAGQCQFLWPVVGRRYTAT